MLMVIGAVLLSIPFVGGTLSSDRGQEMEAALVASRLLRPSVLTAGQIAHERQVQLTSEVLGTVEAVLVAEGNRVERGQLVLAIDSETYAADVVLNRAAVRLEETGIARSKAHVADLSRQLDRSARLFEDHLLDARSLEAAAHQLELARLDTRAGNERLEQARARLEQSETRLGKTQVRAPMNGIVTAVDIEVGETAVPSSTNIPGSQLLTIGDPTRLIAEVHVDEADIASVHVGQAAEIVAVAHPDQPLEGRVEFVANTARKRPDRRALSFLARIRIAPTNRIRLRPGVSCRAEIFTDDGHESLAVPIQAVVADQTPRWEGREFVFVADNGSVRRVQVRTGRSDDAYQEITSGLREGDLVITGPGRALRRLRDGDAIRLAPGHSGDTSGSKG